MTTQPKARSRIVLPALIGLAVAAALVALAGLPSPAVRAQGRGVKGPNVGEVTIPTSFQGDVRTLPRASPKDSGEKLFPLRAMPKSGKAPLLPDPVVQTRALTGAMPTPLVSFKGLDRQNWGSGVPSDANGDVGPAHYIQAVNTSIGIFSKTGTRLAAFTFNTFWANANSSTSCDDEHEGDPIVLYDPYADRWMIADLAFGSYTGGPFYFCIAVSKTGDPVAGGWWLYPMLADADWLSDYPKFGVWRDGYYATANLFDTSAGNAFKGVRVWALDREAMILGDAFSPISFDVPCTPEACYAGLLPGNFRGTLPPTGSPNFFASIDEPNVLHLWKFHVDWNTPLHSTFTGPTDLTVANFVMPCEAATIYACVPQIESPEKVDALGDRLMMQLQYRKRTGTESLWVNHTVATGSAVGVPTGIRWYEIRDPNGAPTIYQQGTLAPDSNYRWMGSLATDQKGNMALGYSVSSSDLYPAIRYAGRLAGDALDELSQGEQTLIQGTGAQSGGSNRWGDYSAMTVDPVDDCTFWYTNQYLEVTGSNWLTRIGAFRFPDCADSPTPAPSPTACSTVPAKPTLLSPPKRALVSSRLVPLDWEDAVCADAYVVMVQRNSRTGKVVDRQTVSESQTTTAKLKRGKTFFWRVRACNAIGCGEWTGYRKFTVSPNAN